MNLIIFSIIEQGKFKWWDLSGGGKLREQGLYLQSSKIDVLRVKKEVEDSKLELSGEEERKGMWLVMKDSSGWNVFKFWNIDLNKVLFVWDMDEVSVGMGGDMIFFRGVCYWLELNKWVMEI